MKRIKRPAAAFMVLALIITFLPVGVFTIPVHAAEDKTADISVESVSTLPGATTDVNVLIKGNPGILGATLQFAYDPGLTLVDAKAGSAFDSLFMTKPGQFVSPCKFSWDGEAITDEDIKDGVILTLSFKVDENAVPGSEYAVRVDYEYGDVIDGDLQPVVLNMTGGKVTVIDYTPGDVNDDGKINTTDLVYARRFITGGYNVSINEDAADVNADGRINTTDLVLIRRYIVGGYGVVLKPAADKHTHMMEAVARKEATCTEEGNIAYWHCTTCDKYFTDIMGVKSVALEETVITAAGHTVVTDPAVEATFTSTGLTEGSHCSVCNEVLVAQEVIPKLEKDEYSITYHLYNGDAYLEKLGVENPNPDHYASEDGLKLANIKAEGYIFEGWYDGEGANAELVKQIEKGETGSRELYARWTLREYTVQFDSPLAAVSSVKYTVDKGVTLTNPEWFGYTFVGWTDAEGNIVRSINPGTTGNITLYANWTSKRNQTIPITELDAPIIYEDTENGMYLFAYEIGRIENVPLYTIKDFGNRSGITVTETTSTSGSISETSANTIASMISNATTRSDSWTLSEEWNQSTTISEEHSSEVSSEVIQSATESHDATGKWNISSGSGGTSSTTTEVGTSAKVSSKVSGSVSAGPYKVEAEVGAEMGTTTKDSETNTRNWNTSRGFEGSNTASTSSSSSSSLSSKISDTKGYSQTQAHNMSNSSTSALAVSQTNSREYASSLSYASAKTETSVKEYTNQDAPEGYYRLVAAGTVHVFAVVGYDIATRSYFTYTYNILDDEVKDFIDYSKTTSNFDDYENGVLPFEVPYEVNEYINNVINSSYGLVVDIETGKIVAYNGDGTTTVVKVTGFEAGAFKNNTNITSVKFGKYVTEIPDSAFEGCTSLQTIEGPSIERIGNRAFYGCVSLNEFTVSDRIQDLGDTAFEGVDRVIVNAVNTEIAKAAIGCGAKQIVLNNVSGGSILDNTTVEVSDCVEYFEFNGANHTYSGLRILSDAATTVINGVIITDTTEVPLKLSSANVTLNRVTVTAPELAMVLTGDAVTLSLYGTVDISTESSNAVLCKNLVLQQANPQAVGKLNVSGNVMVCGEIEDRGMLTVTNGEVLYIDGETYEKLLYASLDWVLESEMPEGATVVGEKWTYDLTTTTTAPMDTLEGYTLYDSTWTWGNYGNWSGWSRTAYSGSDSRQVETRTVTDSAAYTNYTYYYYRYWNSSAGTYYYTYSSSMGGTKYTKTLTSPMTAGNVYSGHQGYSKPGGGYYNFSGEIWFLESTSNVPAATHQEWRYRDRPQVYTYYFKKVEQQESLTEVAASDSISNVQKWVQYVVNQ